MKLPDAISAIPGITVEAWDDLTPSAQAIILAIVGHYEQRIAELEDRLKRNPSNSSMPPSSDILQEAEENGHPSSLPRHWAETRGHQREA